MARFKKYNEIFYSFLINTYLLSFIQLDFNSTHVIVSFHSLHTTT